MSSFRKTNLSGGELAPEHWAKVDLVKHQTGLKTLRNCSIARSGGARNRPGTVIVAESYGTTRRLIKFLYQTNEIILAFDNTYIRWIKDGTLATEGAKTISAITQASPGVITSAAHGYSNGDFVRLTIAGMAQLNNRDMIVAGVTTNTFQITNMFGSPIDTSAYQAFASGSAFRHRRVAHGINSAVLGYLKFAQPDGFSPMTVVHPQYPPQELSYNGTTFTFGAITFAPNLPAPVVVGSASTGTDTQWCVTAVDALTGEESVASAQVTASAFPTSGSAQVLSITQVSGAAFYRIYRGALGGGSSGITGYGFIGQVADSGTATTKYVDVGAIAKYGEDFAQRPPNSRNVFNGAGNYPSSVIFYQQRQIFACSFNEPNGLWASRIGCFKNFFKLSPLTDDSSLKFLIPGYLNKIANLLDLGTLIAMTDKDERNFKGNAAGELTPTSPGVVSNTSFGSDELFPILLDSGAIFLQRKSQLPGSGNIIRDISFQFQSDSYKGNDLTVFARHLFKNYSIVDWGYSRDPDSLIWAVRNDGVLLCLTYFQDQQIWGWSRNDTFGVVAGRNAAFKNVCTGNVLISALGSTVGGITVYYSMSVQPDIPFFTVDRTLTGFGVLGTVNLIERMTPRDFSDVRDCVFMDCAGVYDGRANTSGKAFSAGYTGTMTVTGGTNWNEEEILTCTASVAIFTATDVGNEVHLYVTDPITGLITSTTRCTITAYSSSTVVSVRPDKTIPVDQQGAPVSSWARAVSHVSGLWALEGQPVSVLGDGDVLASPNNPDYDPITISGGVLTLPRCCGIIAAGLPYLSDIETLDLDVSDGETISDKKSMINEVTLQLVDSRGIFVGNGAPDDDDTDATEGLNELKTEEHEDYDDVHKLMTGKFKETIEGNWDSAGRIFIRQVDPLPMHVEAIIPAGLVPTQARK